MLQNRTRALAQAAGTTAAPALIRVSIDEKPGVQAIANTAPDLPPVAGKHPQVARDHEYKRHGTLSILASLDLHDGHVVARVEPRHRSREFVALLKDLDAYYPPGGGHPHHSRRSFGAHFQGDPRLSGHPPQPLHLCAHAQTRLVAEFGRDALW